VSWLGILQAGNRSIVAGPEQRRAAAIAEGGDRPREVRAALRWRFS